MNHLLTWPGGRALPHSGPYWRSYNSPRDCGDHLREHHWTSGPGGTSIPYSVMDDYGVLVPVPAP